MSYLAEQAVEIVGALMLLAAYALAQFYGMNRHGYPFLLLNAGGSLILTVLGSLHQQWGFVLVQVVWLLVACWGLAGRLRGGRAA